MKWGGPFDPQAEAIYVAASIHGPTGYRRKFIGLIDTGTQMTVLDIRMAHTMDLDESRSIGGVTFDSLTHPIEGYRVFAPALDVYGRRLENLEIACCPMSTTLEVDALIGLDFLRGLDVRFTFQTGLITLSEEILLP